jgi:hypothetical protein
MLIVGPVPPAKFQRNYLKNVCIASINVLEIL